MAKILNKELKNITGGMSSKNQKITDVSVKTSTSSPITPSSVKSPEMLPTLLGQLDATPPKGGMGDLVKGK